MHKLHFMQKGPISGRFPPKNAVFRAIFGHYFESGFLIFEPVPPGKGPFRSGKN